MALASFLTLVSFVVLFVGAELLVRGGVSLALRLGLSSLVIGLTVVAYGTSLPEFVVSLNAAFAGGAGIALGNVVGSNIFNLAVILGLAGLVKPMRCERTFVTRECSYMIEATLLAFLLMTDGRLTRIDGGILVASLLAFTVISIRLAKKNPSETEDLPAGAAKLPSSIFLIVAGLVVLVLGSRLLVDNAIIIARHWGISDAIIGLTIVSAGTSMPELATSVVAAFRGHSDIALGNVVGSNIFNLLLVLGGAALVHPLPTASIKHTDFTALFAVTLLMPLLLFKSGRLSRGSAALLLTGYGVYLYFLWPK